MTRLQQRRQIHKKLLYARLRYLVALVAKPCAIVLAASLVVAVTLANRQQWQPLLDAITIILVAGVLIVRCRGRIHSLYKTAQLLDSRANLQDRISTAWYLLQNPEYADRPIAAAHIADVAGGIEQISLREPFPLPRKTLAAVVSIAFLLILTRATSLPSSSIGFSKTIARQPQQNSFRPAPGSKSVEDGAAVADEKGSAHAQAVGQEDAPRNAAPGQQAQPAPPGERTKSPGTDAENNNQQGGFEPASAMTDTREKTAASPTAANRQQGSAHGETSQKDRQQEETPHTGDSSVRSLMSQMFSPLKRLFGTGQSQEHQTRVNAASERSLPPADSKGAVTREQAAAVTHDQQPALAGGAQYVFADPSAKQASSKKLSGLPSGVPTTEVEPIAEVSSMKIPHSDEASVSANPNGEIGHTRVQASRGAIVRPRSPAMNADRRPPSRQDAVQLTARAAVPLAYRSRIQTYMEAARDQPRTPDGPGNQF